MSAVFTVFLKEVVENLRDRRTVTSSLLMGPLLGPIIFVALMSLVLGRELERAEKPLTLPVAGAKSAPNLVGYLERHGVKIEEAPANPEKAVADQDKDVVLRIPDDYAAAWRKGEPAPIEIVYDASQRDSSGPVGRVKRTLEAYGREVAALRLLSRGIHPGVSYPLAIVERDQSTPQSRAGLLLAFLPYIMMIGTFIGGMYLAIDTTAGERERRSLEPLLATPNTAAQIMFGKLGATCAFALASLILTLIAFGFGVPRLPLDQLGFRLDFGVLTAAKILLLCAPIVLFASALQTVIAAFARSYREAQSYLQLLLFVPMIPSLLLMVLPVKIQTWMMAVPLLSQNLLINKLVRGEEVPVSHTALAISTALVLGIITTAIAAKLYSREQLAVSA